MHCIIYTRVSSEEQVKGMSLDFQREDCLRYADDMGFAVKEIFVEEGESAKFANRPQFLNLLSYCRKYRKSIDAIIVWKLDRLSRNQMDYYFIKRTLYDLGITIHSATERTLGDSSSIEAKVFETFSALQAEIDNTVRRDRSIRGMAAKIEVGIYPWHPPPGYCSAYNRRHGLKKTEPDQPDPDRFHLIKRLFETCLHERIQGNVALAQRANAWGLTTPTGKTLYPQVIDRILKNPFYAGILTNPWTGEEHIGQHKPVLSPDEFRMIQLIRQGKIPTASASHRREHPDFPLRRTVLCGSCRAPLTVPLLDILSHAWCSAFLV